MPSAMHGRHHDHVGALRQQAQHAAGGHLSATDDQHAPPGEAHEERIHDFDATQAPGGPVDGHNHEDGRTLIAWISPPRF